MDVKEVWDFEIFDILIHTFMSRMKKKYKDSEIIGEIKEFESYVISIRKKMVKSNHEFFMDVYENIEIINVEEKKNLLQNFIGENMNAISNREYKFGRDI